MEVRVGDGHCVPLVDEDGLHVIGRVAENDLAVFGACQQKILVKRAELNLVDGAGMNLVLSVYHLLAGNVKYHDAPVVASDSDDALVKLVEAYRAAHEPIAEVAEHSSRNDRTIARVHDEKLAIVCNNCADFRVERAEREAVDGRIYLDCVKGALFTRVV